MEWFFITGGLLMGWSLGANDGVNVFGTAVASRMLRFGTATLIAGVFVILGAVVSGAGPARTLNDLGAINALAGSFTVVLACAAAVAWMTRMSLPVSTSQAIVGGIVGWNFFTGSPTDIASFSKIVLTWVLCPILAAAFAFVLFKGVTAILRRAKLHILHLDAYTRIGLIAVGAFASYSLGANNIANVMGLFISASPFGDLTLTPFLTITGTEQLFLLGGLAIAVGVFTYGHRVMLTVGNELYKITPLSALLVVLSQALVLFLFASENLEQWLISLGLPAIPLVPVSATQAVVGAVIGVGLAKGGKGINYKVLGRIALGWVATPLTACALSVVALFVVQNVFEQKVVTLTPHKLTQASVNALEQEGIATKPLNPLRGKLFIGAASFRSALRNTSPWTEKELFKIFSYAELDTLKVDSTRAKAQLGDDLLSLEQMRAIVSLHGQTFVHRWQLDSALVNASEEWMPKTGSGHDAFNKTLKDKYRLIHPTFRKR